jgi:hypothetical protein
MKVESWREEPPAGRPEEEGEGRSRPRLPYQPPRVVKKRAVSRATLFTGSGPNSGGVIGEGG